MRDRAARRGCPDPRMEDSDDAEGWRQMFQLRARPERSWRMTDQAVHRRAIGIGIVGADSMGGGVVGDNDTNRVVSVVIRIDTVRNPERCERHDERRGNATCSLAEPIEHQRTTVVALPGLGRSSLTILASAAHGSSSPQSRNTSSTSRRY